MCVIPRSFLISLSGFWRQFPFFHPPLFLFRLDPLAESHFRREPMAVTAGSVLSPLSFLESQTKSPRPRPQVGTSCSFPEPSPEPVHTACFPDRCVRARCREHGDLHKRPPPFPEPRNRDFALQQADRVLLLAVLHPQVSWKPSGRE